MYLIAASTKGSWNATGLVNLCASKRRVVNVSGPSTFSCLFRSVVPWCGSHFYCVCVSVKRSFSGERTRKTPTALVQGGSSLLKPSVVHCLCFGPGITSSPLGPFRVRSADGTIYRAALLLSRGGGAGHPVSNLHPGVMRLGCQRGARWVDLGAVGQTICAVNPDKWNSSKAS